MQNGSDGEPVVTHGNTFTSKILFRDVIRFLSVFAFENNSLPLCISIENHCNSKQQLIMQNYITEYFGYQLYVPLEADLKVKRFTSLAMLQNKLILQTRGDNDFDRSDSQQENSREELDLSGQAEPGTPTKTFERSESVELSKSELTPTRAPKSPLSVKPEEKVMLNPHFQSILSLVTVSNLDPHDNPFVIYSISEARFDREAKNGSSETLHLYSDDHFIRVYPKMTRISSSNFDPTQYWDYGAQMCAMNFQTPDRGMRLNQALFLANRGLGYVLKPYASPESLSGKNNGSLIRFTFLGLQEWTSVCGHSFYLKLEVFGAKADQRRNKVRYIDPSKMKAQPVPSGIHHVSKTTPHTYEQSHNLSASSTEKQTITVERETQVEFLLARPKSAFLEITVYKKSMLSSHPVGLGVIPISLLKSGLLPIQLYDKQRHRMPHAAVLAKLEIVTASSHSS